MELQPSDAGEIVMFGALPTMVALLSLLVGVANIVWTWIQKGQAVAADRVKTLEGSLIQLEGEMVLAKQRLIQLEGDYKHLPTKDDINGLRVQLQDVMGQQRSTQNELASVNRTVGRIDDFLREKA